MNNSKRVSVIINCFNSEKYIEECLKSVLNQTHINLEVIIVDNNSTDNTKKIIEKFNDDRIRYFYLNDHLKLGEARNYALKKCSGEFIAFIDSDDIWVNYKLEEQIKIFSKPDVGLVFCNSYKFKEDGWKQKIYKKAPPTGYIFRNLFVNYFISLETVIIRRDVIFKLKRYFYEEFQIIEEFDLICRLSLITKFEYVDKVMAYWRFREDSFTWKNRHLIHKERKTMLRLFYQEINSFENSYNNEIILFNKRTLLEEILYLIQCNQIKLAKIKLKKYLFKDLKWTLLYFILSSYFLTKIVMRRFGYLY